MTEPTPKTRPTPGEQKAIDERLDEQGRQSFPASDPPAQPGIVGPRTRLPPPDTPGRKR
jgi:hypothetical protein